MLNFLTLPFRPFFLSLHPLVICIQNVEALCGVYIEEGQQRSLSVALALIAHDHGRASTMSWPRGLHFSGR